MNGYLVLITETGPFFTVPYKAKQAINSEKSSPSIKGKHCYSPFRPTLYMREVLEQCH
jgi:hypothetical protein